MYKLDLPVDYKEAAAIERRRNMEEQRKSRIFNAKSRTIGVSSFCLFFMLKFNLNYENMCVKLSLDYTLARISAIVSDILQREDHQRP